MRMGKSHGLIEDDMHRIPIYPSRLTFSFSSTRQDPVWSSLRTLSAGSRRASDLHNLRSGTYFVGISRCLGVEGTDCRSDRH